MHIQGHYNRPMESTVVILVCTNPCVHQEHAYTFLDQKFVLE